MQLSELLDEFSKRPDSARFQDRIEVERRSRPGMENYFENVFLAYRIPIEDRQYPLAIQRALSLFDFYQRNASDFDAQHKGSPFYVMGYAAFASHDYPTASLMFDAAAGEDLRYWGQPAATGKPALLFLRLKDENQDALASEIIRDIIQALEGLLDGYRSRPDAVPLSLGELRDHFLDRFINSAEEHKRTLATAFISFVAEYKYRSRLMGLVQRGSREPFFLHLLRGCVLLESILKESPLMQKNPGTLENAIKRVRVELRMPSKFDISAGSFDKRVLQEIGPNMPAAKAVEYTGRCRNTIGHSLSWETPSLNKATYDLLVEIIASACIHAISTTYR